MGRSGRKVLAFRCVAGQRRSIRGHTTIHASLDNIIKISQTVESDLQKEPPIGVCASRIAGRIPPPDQRLENFEGEPPISLKSLT